MKARTHAKRPRNVAPATLPLAPGSASVDWQAQLDALIKETRSFVARPTDACVITSLAAQVLLARRDKERLDWLIAHSAYVAHATDGEVCWVMMTLDEETGDECVSTAPHYNAREAIDAAMRGPNNKSSQPGQ